MAVNVPVLWMRSLREGRSGNSPETCREETWLLRPRAKCSFHPGCACLRCLIAVLAPRKVGSLDSATELGSRSFL